MRLGGAVALSEAVAANAGLRSLVLRKNNIGTAAGLQMGIALARKSGTTCLVDIQVGWSNKEDTTPIYLVEMRCSKTCVCRLELCALYCSGVLHA